MWAAVKTSLHLDTGNWIRLSRDSILGAKSEDALSRQELMPCLSLVHAFEFARPARAETRRVVTSYIDQVCDRHGVLWVRSRHELEIEEIRCELFRQMGLEYTPRSPFVSTLPDSMDHDRTGDDLESWRKWTFEQNVESLHRSPSYESDYRAFRTTEHLQHHEAGKPPIHPLEKAVTMLPQRVRLLDGDELDVDPEVFRREFELSNCPVLQMTYAYNSRWIEGADADPQDFEDLLHLPSVANATVAFVDGETRDLLRQGGVPGDRLPLTNGEFRAWIEGNESR